MIREISIINHLLKKEIEYKEKLENELSGAEYGSLCIKHRKNRITFEEYNNGELKWLNKKSLKIYQIAHYNYIRKLHKISSQTCELLLNTHKCIEAIVQKSGLDKLLERYSVLELQKVKLSQIEYDWCMNYESNPYKPEALKYRTSNGVRMRSKSERTIGNKLEEYNIPYRYEAKLIIDGKVYYPDFMILCSDGSIVIWEHQGLMDDEEYRMKALMKIVHYNKAGYKQHRNLICTWEDDIEDMSNLDEIICRFILKV